MGIIFVVPLSIAAVALVAIVMREARNRSAGQPVKRPLYMTVVIGLLALLLTAFLGRYLAVSLESWLAPGGLRERTWPPSRRSRSTA